MISFIVPAHNEEAWVGRCVSAIRNGVESLGQPHEIIVVDDASSDATAAIARKQGAQVVRVEHRQIAATRNAGAQQSRGDILFFVDADTLLITLLLAYFRKCGLREDRVLVLVHNQTIL